MAIRSTAKFTSLSELESGMIIRFSYDGKQRVVLVIDPDKDAQLHGIDISGFSDTELLKIVTDFGVTPISEDNRTLTTGLNSAEAYAAYKSSPLASGRKYRTYTVSKISQLRRVEIGDVDTKKTR